MQDFSQSSDQNIDYQQSVTCANFANFQFRSDREPKGTSLMASSHVDGSVRVYKFDSFEELSMKHREHRPDIVFKEHFYSANMVEFPRNDPKLLHFNSNVGHQQWLLSCSDDTLIHMYDLEKCKIARSFVGHQRFVTHCKFNNIANIVLSAGADNTIALWDIRSNKQIFRILAHPEPITSIDISEDSTLISSSSYDCYVRLWDMIKGQCLKTMMADAGSTDAFSFCRMTPHHSEYLLFGNMNSSMGLYNYENELLKEYKGHVNKSYCIDAKFIKNKKTEDYMILTGSEDGVLYGWDLNSQRLQIKLPIIPDFNEYRLGMLPSEFGSHNENVKAALNDPKAYKTIL